MAQARNICMHQYLVDWLIRAKDKDSCFQDTQTLLALCQELGWVVNLKKSELEPKQVFNFVGYQYGQVGSPKLQNQHPPGEDQLFRETTHVIDRPSHGDRETGSFWASTNETHPVAPEEPLVYNKIVGEGHPDSQVPSKKFEPLCRGRVVLVATDNTTVVAYLNKEGGMHSGSLCALLWRLLSWYNLREICLRARHIPGRLNVIADKLSRHQQVIQTEWSLHPDVFAQICHRWHLPKVDLFATRYSCKLPQFMSPVPDPKAWAVDALSLSWEDLDLYAFPPIPLLTNIFTKALGHQCKRMIVIAPGWPNMPWFWDLVEMSSQIPLCFPDCPDLLSQPFNGSLHRDLQNLNLHAWLLEPRPFGNKGSLTKWQRELKLLKEGLPDLSMNQSGPFLFDGARSIRWTPIHLL